MNKIKVLVSLLALTGSAQAMQQYSSIHEAARAGNVEAVQAFLDAGVPINQASNHYGWTALHFAMSNDKQACCKLLINRLLKMPNPAQRTRIYTFLMCMKRRNLSRDIRSLFKPHLIEIITAENKDRYHQEESIAWQEIDKSNFTIKYDLMRQYWPESYRGRWKGIYW